MLPPPEVLCFWPVITYMVYATFDGAVLSALLTTEKVLDYLSE
ncbi:hypothetical protein ACFL27_00250 [candidate division CSSED10-310 bacterium]|uniref:Uncharacterized protein n=1 Tax=candidate division CSSED10-310 bacterium TaxID=2855610 RepID=A0ABV6YQX7_UNCC1